MTTQTNTLRRALETFAKTGKITLTASALMALALSAPVNAAEKNFSESVIIEESTTVPAGDTYNYKVPEADAYNPIPGDLLEEPNSGLILNNGTLTIAGTANLTANFSSGSAVGDVSNLVIEDGGIFNVSRYSHMARHKDSVSNLTIKAGGTMNQTKSFYFGCRGESTADIYGTLNITDGNFHIGANYAYADETFRKNAVGIVTVHKGGVVTLTGSGRHISLGRFGSVNTTDKNVGILNIDGGTVTAPSISCADDSGLADKYTNTDYSHAEVNITKGGTLNVGSVTMPYGTGWIVVDGAGSALNVTDTINMYWKDLEVRNGGTVNATKVVSGGYAETAFILDGGTANISGTFTNNGKTANGGGLIIKNGGLLNLTGSNTIDGSGEIVISSGEIKTSDKTLALTGKTLNYSGGTLPETLKLTNTVLNISNTAAWNVTSVQELGDKNSLISVLFAAPTDGSTSGTVLESTNVSTFETSDVTLTFTSGGKNLRPIVSGTSANGIAYTLEQTKNLILTREKTETKAETFTQLGALQKGDHILMTNDVTVDACVTLPETLTIEGNSTEGRTISGNGTSWILATPEDAATTLTLKNLTLDEGKGYVPAGESTRGGAIYAGELTLHTENVTFKNCSVDQFGGAIAADGGDLTLTGNSRFENNTSTRSHGGALGTGNLLTVSGTHTFIGNTAATGGALGSIFGDVVISGNNKFTDNIATNGGGAINSGFVSDVILWGDGSVAVFEGNKKGDTPNDIMTGNYGEGSVIVKDKGTYTFGGGILSKELSITDGANVTFGKDSLTSVNKLTTDEESTIHGNINVGKDGTEAGAVNVKDAFAIDGFTGTKEDGVKIDGNINFADGAKIEISFGEGLDFAFDGEYTLLTSNNILTETDLNNIEFSFVNAVDGMQERGLFEIKPGLHGEMMLNITGLSTVPEPTTWALLVLGGLGVFGIARKNRKAKK